MAKTPQISFGLPVFICLILGFVSSCGEKKERKSVEAEPEFEEKVYTFLAEDRFDYSDGRLVGNKPPKGFTGNWAGKGAGSATVRRGRVWMRASLRTSCVFDTSPGGPFAEYVDGNKMIGKDGTTIYISYYQALTKVAEDQVGIVEFVQGDGDVHFKTQFNTGTDTTPRPVGPFGLRAKRNTDYIIAAPEELNSRENLIVLKIMFGEKDQDRIYYYYNPTPEDEKMPAGAVVCDDLSFDRYGISCFGGTEMKFRHLRVADNFEAVAIDGL